MNKFQKSQLLLATALVGSVAGTAQAQVVFPSAELHGMGASSIATIMPREMNCIGTAGAVASTDASGNVTYTSILAAGATPMVDASSNPLTKLNLKVGKNDGSAAAVTAGNYVGADAPFNCAVKNIQPGFAGLYISTGSGGGKTAWKNINAGSFFNGSTGKVFPTTYFGTLWTNPQFVMSDSAISPSDKTTFESVAVQTTGKVGGKAIQIPLYVLPVAVIYNPVYGRKVDASGNAVNDASGNPITYSFNVGAPQTFNGVATGGLRLSKQVYCGIFNGYITNWNNAAITALNLKVVNKKTVAVSLMAANDSTTRWDADGVPIRLVGRADKSGTTDIFTRHLSQVCGGIMPGGANKYTAQSEALPYNPASGADIYAVDTNSPYFPNTNTTALGTNASNPTTFAGSSDMISGAFWNGTTVSGTEALGKFTVADGSGKLESYIIAAADKASASDATVLLNGKVGYVGADFVAPSGGKLMHAAALEVGQTNATKKPVFAMPTAVNAQAAFGTKILPPEADKGGKYTHSGTFKRSNPADWYDALYFGESTLGNPTVGYPITGTTQFVTGTCFAKPENRNAIVQLLNTLLGNVKFDSTGAKVSSETFTGVKAAKLGIRPQAGLAPLPKAWNVAITETFLVRSKQKASDGTLLSAANLYIQNGLPTKAGLAKLKGKTTLAASDLPVNGVTDVQDLKGKTVTFAEGTSNSACTAGSGL